MAFIWLVQAYDEVVSDGVAVESALAGAQRKADAYRECLAERDGFQDLGIIRACSAEVDGE